MDREDRGKFANRMWLMAMTLGSDRPEEAVLRRYWEALKEYRIEDVEEAISLAEKTETFYPKPATIIKLIQEVQEDRGRMTEDDKHAAWERDRQLHPEDYYTQEEILEVMEKIKQQLGFVPDFGRREVG